MTPEAVQERIVAIGSKIHRANELLLFPFAPPQAIASPAMPGRGACGRPGDMLTAAAAPGSLDRCAEILESAARELAGLRSALSPSDRNSESMDAACNLQRAIRTATALLENASAFHVAWSQTLAAMCGGYQAGGAPAPMIRQARLSVQG